MDKFKFLLNNFCLFKNISEDELNKIFSTNGLKEETFSSQTVFYNYQSCDKIGIIIKGRAVIRSGIDGVIIKKLTIGDMYGVASMFEKPSHSTIVMSVKDCTVLTMNKEFIENCIKISTTFATNYIMLLSQKINFLNNKINFFTAKSAENKVYSYLLQLPRKGNKLEMTIDMSTMAKMIGIGRATLYRALDKLETCGTIEKINKTIIFKEVWLWKKFYHYCLFAYF